jgi:hypothetical protein
MKRVTLLAVLLAVSLAALLAVLLVPGRTPDETRVMNKWAKVEALRLPEATLAEITEALGPCDSEDNYSTDDWNDTTYEWYRFGGIGIDGFGGSGMDGTGSRWHMLRITLRYGRTMSFVRTKPLIRANGALEAVTFDEGWRDKHDKWHSGPLPTPSLDELGR